MTAAGVVPVGMVTDLQVKLDEISSSVDAQLSEIEAQHATALAAVAAELHKKWTAKMAALEKEMCELEDSAMDAEDDMMEAHAKQLSEANAAAAVAVNAAVAAAVSTERATNSARTTALKSKLATYLPQRTLDGGCFGSRGSSTTAKSGMAPRDIALRLGMTGEVGAGRSLARREPYKRKYSSYAKSTRHEKVAGTLYLWDTITAGNCRMLAIEQGIEY